MSRDKSPDTRTHPRPKRLGSPRNPKLFCVLKRNEKTGSLACKFVDPYSEVLGLNPRPGNWLSSLRDFFVVLRSPPHKLQDNALIRQWRLISKSFQTTLHLLLAITQTLYIPGRLPGKSPSLHLSLSLSLKFTCAGSSPDWVTGFLNWPNPSSSTMALGSIQPLTEMSTRNLPEGKIASGA
jgi:hypothetical protein